MVAQTKGGRLFSLDLLRVVACYLVMHQHASEFYYVTQTGAVVQNQNTFWIGIITSLGRISVPLFVMISGFFLLPMKDTTPVFFRKRMTRVLYPFLFWCVGYAVFFMFYRGDTLSQMGLNILQIPVNFGVDVGHLWYIYMLIGLYTLVPVLSPWLRSCSKKELQFYLWIWAFTTLLPYIHLLFPGICGECFWNPTPMLYYFTGFVGYLLLGYYIKAYGSLSVAKSLLLVVVGYAVTASVYCSRIYQVTHVSDLELSWSFCSLNVVMMTYGVFSLFKAINCSRENAVTRWISDVSAKSYGMYLAHIMVLDLYFLFFGHTFSTTLVSVPLLAVLTFFTIYLVIKLLSYLPKSKYWLGI